MAYDPYGPGPRRSSSGGSRISSSKRGSSSRSPSRSAPPRSSSTGRRAPSNQSRQATGTATRDPNVLPRKKKKLTPEQAARRRARIRRKKQQRMLFRLGALAVLVLLIILIVRACGGKKEKEAEEPLPSASPVAVVTPPPEDTTATLAVVGDIMSHMPITNAVYDDSSNTYDYTPIFQYMEHWLSDPDYTIGNFETTMSSGEYSGYPLFNSPDELAKGLKEVGFDLVTTANNHCLDQGFDGLCRTLDVLDQYGLAHVGTYRSQEEFDASKGVTVADINGISVAFLDYTYGTNYITVRNEFSVNLFAADEDHHDQFLTDKLDEEMEYARSLDTDLIIVCVHWGYEYQTTEEPYQDDLADYFIAQGADAVLGGHAHVPQPLEYRTVTDWQGNQSTGFVCFSLGNFTSNQSDQYTDTTAVLNLELTKDGATGETQITDVTYVPLLMLNRGEGTSPRYLLLDARAGIADYEGSQQNHYITGSVYQDLKTCMDDLKEIFGSSWQLTPETGAGTPSSNASETLNPESSAPSSGGTAGNGTLSSGQ